MRERDLGDDRPVRPRHCRDQVRSAHRPDHRAGGLIDPTGSEPIPTIIDGIVTHVRDIRVSIDRTAFTLNPSEL